MNKLAYFGVIIILDFVTIVCSIIGAALFMLGIFAIGKALFAVAAFASIIAYFLANAIKED